MKQDVNADHGKTFIEPAKWCRYLVRVGYVTAALMVLAHIIWFFAASSVLALPRDVYLLDYILYPAVGLFLLTLLVDRLVRLPRVPLAAKELLSLSLFSAFSLYLCFTHPIAKVLLGSFILPIFISTLFSDLRVTRWVFITSCVSLLLLGVMQRLEGTLDASMAMQLFVAFFMYLCAYLLARIILRYGHDHLATLTVFDNQSRYMREQLKLDPFTGLYNRKTFDDYLPAMMAECRKTGKCLSLAMIDLDHFKRINDHFGHAVGDHVLLCLADILKSRQAENIRAFRIGGEEFTVLFRDCDTEEAYRICEAVRLQMASAALPDIDRQSVTFSCGLVCMDPTQVDLEAFTKAVDAALYQAKNNGRNQVVIGANPV